MGLVNDIVYGIVDYLAMSYSPTPTTPNAIGGSTVARPLRQIVVNFTPTTNADETISHPIFQVSPTASSRPSLHAKRTSDIAAMMRQAEQTVLKENQVIYLIEFGWFCRMKQHDENISGCTFNEEINNWPLICNGSQLQTRGRYDYDTCIYDLDPDIEQNRDFIIVSENIWTALRSWYGGGPPLPRQVISRTNGPRKTLELDLFPLSLLCMQGVKRISTYSSSTNTASLDICFSCKKPAFDRCKGCSSVYYCSRECQSSHWMYHKLRCKPAAQNKDVDSNVLKNTSVIIGRQGKAGLMNLGNSCYINSGLQCLSHVFSLTSFLLSDKYLTQVNELNIDGSRGLLVKEYTNLLRELWFGSNQCVSPISFKRIFGKINPDYAGFSQHDVFEAFEFLIDKIHEDLNKVIKKPYVEMPEGDGTNDVEISRLAWV